ncbi:MAG: hypothetical protein ABIU54_00685 [Candidatus Eisenbacteria bacterium]
MRLAASVDGLGVLDAAAKGLFPASLYIEGPNEALKAGFLAEFRGAWAQAVPEAPLARILRPGENDVDEILSAYQGISMFASRELTFVMGVEQMTRSERNITALAEGISRPAGESCIVLIESMGDTYRKTLDPLRGAAAARWDALPLDRRNLLTWGVRRLASMGFEAEPGALEALCDACEAETLAFFNELSKLPALSADGRHVRKAEVETLTRPIVGSGVAEYLAAVALGKPGLAGQRLGRLLAAGESEGGLMFLLGNMVGGAFGTWSVHREISAQLGRRSNARSLARALDAVYRAEAAWKSGRVDSLTALEQATREVAGS